jgi:hypothetical protein
MANAHSNYQDKDVDPPKQKNQTEPKKIKENDAARWITVWYYVMVSNPNVPNANVPNIPVPNLDMSTRRGAESPS